MNQKPIATGKKKDDAVHDLEQQFILRLPPGPAMALRHDVQSGAMNLKEKLSIELLPDARRGKVTYGGQIFNAKMVDLPCIVESLKTTDRKSFYKTADISQLLLCTNDDDDSPEEVEFSPKKKEKDKRYLWNHGVCPPLKNVRKRRFRKTLQKKYQEQPDLEKEVKRLFRTDNEAKSIKYEVIYEDEKPDELDPDDKTGIIDDNKGNLIEIAEHEIFGEVSSSEDEGERDVNVLDSGDEGQDVKVGSKLKRVDTKDSLASLVDYNLAESAASFDPDISELQNRLSELDAQVKDLHERREQYEMEISILEGSSAKERLQNELDAVIEEESRKQQEIAILSSMLSH